MTKRLQVLFEDDEYRQIQDFAARERITVADWVRQALRAALSQRHQDIQAKLDGIREAARNDYPTGDIDQMLKEIAPGSLRGVIAKR